MAEYKWTSGCRISNKVMPAQVAGDELERLQQENDGRITPRLVVEAARPLEAPLHPAFEWDDLRAAELFREDQARHVISAIRVVTPSVSGPKDTTHAFVSLMEERDGEYERAYVPMARVLSEPTLLRRALEQAAAELKSMEDRYKEFRAIAAAVRSARERVESAA